MFRIVDNFIIELCFVVPLFCVAAESNKCLFVMYEGIKTNYVSLSIACCLLDK